MSNQEVTMKDDNKFCIFSSGNIFFLRTDEIGKASKPILIAL